MFKNSSAEVMSGVVKEWREAKEYYFEKFSHNYNLADKKNPQGSVLSSLVTEKENDILQQALQASGIQAGDDCVLMFDGFMTPKRDISLNDLPSNIVGWDTKPFKTVVKVPDDFDCDAALAEEEDDYVTDDKAAVEKIIYLYPHIKCCDSILWIFDIETGMWREDDKFIIFKAILMKYSDRLELPSNPEKPNPNPKSYGNTGKLINAVCNLIKSAVVDDEWNRRVEDSGKYKLLFKNGIYDMKTKKFEAKFDPDVVFFDRIDYDFPERNEELMTKLDFEFFIKPFTMAQNDGRLGEYYKQRVAQAIAGHYVKDFHFGLGESNAGKSKLANQIENTFMGYVGSFNAECLCSTSVEDDAKSWRWAMLLRHKRLIISGEIKMGSKINGAMLKKINGGDSLTGRGHGGNETPFYPHFACILFANDLPAITPLDDGVIERARSISYCKKFVNKNKDELIPDKEEQQDKDFDNKIKQQSWKEAFLHIILDAFTCDALEVPHMVTDDFKEWTVGTSFDDKFDEDFEITYDFETDWVTNAEFEEWRRDVKEIMSPKRFSTLLLKKGAINKKDGVDCKKNGKRCFYGVKRR